MRFDWMRPFMVGHRDREPSSAADGELPEIVPGAFAAWVLAEHDRDRRLAVVGDACELADGRSGRLVELVEGGSSFFVCRPA